MKNYQPDTQEINAAVLPTPDAFADVIAAEILFDIKKNGRIISQQLLKDSILSGLAKLDLVTIADDDGNTDDDTQGAPFDAIEIRRELMDAITNSIREDFQTLGIKKSASTPFEVNAANAAKEVFDKYFIE